MNKHQEIREHLLDGRSITGLEALELYGVYRLSVVINRLRNKENLDIKTTMLNSDDGKCIFAKYYLAPCNKPKN